MPLQSNGKNKIFKIERNNPVFFWSPFEALPINIQEESIELKSAQFLMSIYPSLIRALGRLTIGKAKSA
jgi:hypothetical protein